MISLRVLLVPLLSMSTPVAAEQLTSYYTTISVQDRRNSSGMRLNDFGAILQQDRANYHRFGRRDAGDESDPFFANRETRAMIPQLFSVRHAGDRYWAGIASGDFDMDVLVQICGSGGRITHLRVDPADGDGYGDC